MSQTDIAARLEKCFAAVFDSLTPAQLRAARADEIAAWDSMATVTLMALVNEEFGIELDLDELETLSSFDAMLAYLKSKVSHG